MKSNRVRLLLISALTSLFLIAAVVLQTNTYELTSYTFSSGGGYSYVTEGSDTTWELISVIGQSTPPGESSSGGEDGYTLQAGFIYTIDADVRGPIIEPDSPVVQLPLAAGSILSFAVTVTDEESGVNPDSVLLYSRRSGTTLWDSLPMSNPTDDRWTHDISALDSSGLDFYFKAYDNVNNSSREPFSGYYSQRIFLPDPGVELSISGQKNPGQQHYVAIAFPLLLDTNDWESIVNELVGKKYNREEIRIFDGFGNEYPDLSPVEPGRALWILRKDEKDEAEVISSGSGESPFTSELYAIPVQAGWNLLGMPFLYSIPIENLSFQSQVLGPGCVRLYNGGTWNSVSNSPVQLLMPGQAYAIYAESSDTLLINPDLGNELVQGSAAPQPSFEIDSLEWWIGISAATVNAMDPGTFAGVHHSAKSSRDLLDQPEAPTIGNYVSAYFEPDGWEMQGSALTTDIRKSAQDGAEWQVRVVSANADQVNLTFENIENLSPALHAYILDDAAKEHHNLRKKQHIEVASGRLNTPKKLRLIVGPVDFIEQKLRALGEIPKEFALYQNYPNPFNPSTTIRFALPESQRVTLHIYDILGRRVRVLADLEAFDAGYHTRIWDGRDNFGMAAASGIYIYQISTEKFSDTSKMMLIK